MISIITICYNEERSIRDTIESVLGLEYEQYEYIIKDGCSTDSTNSIIQEYKCRFDKKGIKFKHIIKKDAGIYDAMNQSIQYVEGEFINFMNSGDVFYDSNVLQNIQNYLDKSIDILYGNSLWVLNDKSEYVYINNHEKLMQGKGVNQQACFYNRQLFCKRQFLLKYRILADYEFLLFLINDNKKFYKVDIIITKYNRNGVSSRKTQKTMEELYMIMKDYGLMNPKTRNRYIKWKIQEIINEFFPTLSDYLVCWHDMRKK